MKAQELRIGNLVNWKGRVIKIEGVQKLDHDKIGYITSQLSAAITIDGIESIRLSKEWLLRVDWKGYKYLYFNSDFCLDEEGHLYYHGDYTGINVFYVHQLQNLYFVLTGNEIEFKDETKENT